MKTASNSFPANVCESDLNINLDLDCESLIVRNPLRAPLNPVFKEMLLALRKVQELVIESSSLVEDISFVELWPKLQSLRIQNDRVRHLPVLPASLRTLSMLGNRGISGLQQLNVLNIEVLSVPIVKATDIPFIDGIESVVNLTVTSWPKDEKVLKLRLPKAKHLQIHGTGISSTSGLDAPSLAQVSISNSKKLNSIDNLDAEMLLIEGCPSINLETFRSPKCKVLRCFSANLAHSLNFMQNLPSIEELLLAKSSIRKADDCRLEMAPKLKRIKIGGLPSKDALNLSLLFPAVTLSNGVECYRAGFVVPTAAFWQE